MEFDRHADRYRTEIAGAVGALGTDVDRLAGEKARLLLDILAAELGPPKHLSLLDVGCGIGMIERDLAPRVRALAGVDVSARSLDQARALAPHASYTHYDGARLPFADGGFDGAFTSCVLHHVPPVARDGFVAEMVRVVRPGGLVAAIEHNPFNPATRWIVARCAFDADAVLLGRREVAGLFARAGARVAGWRYMGFWPRRSARVERLERRLARLPAGAQYCLWALKPAP